MDNQQKPYGEVFLVNKPYKWTSFDAVKKLRNALKVKKVGHAGTLVLEKKRKTSNSIRLKKRNTLVLLFWVKPLILSI